GVRTAEAQRMVELFRERRKDFERHARQDGLSSLKYALLDRQNVNVGGKPAANVVHYRVRIED
ncbi:MAG: hypothetical protein IOC86_05275, partial [Aestuariivirga sp.]|nr:hypothetical protein [Aestuariivirga sp.]